MLISLSVLTIVVALTVIILAVLYGKILVRPHLAPPLAHSPRIAGKVTLLVTSDTGTGDDNQRRVAHLLNRLSLEYSVDAVLFAGDNFIQDGVAGLDDPQWDGKLFSMYNLPGLADIPIYAVLGNHDYRGSVAAQIDMTKRSGGRWCMPARNYSVRFGSLVELIAVDTNFPDGLRLGVFPWDRLVRRACRSPCRWRLVMGHRPLLTGGKYRDVMWHVRVLLGSFLRRVGAVVYVSGHDHNLQHLRKEDRRFVLDQIVVGAGGSELIAPESIAGLTRYAAEQHGAVLAQFNSECSSFSFYTVDGENLAPQYSFSVGDCSNE